MVADIHEDVEIRSADGFVQAALAFAASKARTAGIHQIIVLDIAAECGIVMRGIAHVSAEGHKIIVDAATQFLSGVQCDDLQRTYGKRVFKFA